MLIDIHKQAIEKYRQIKFKRQAEEQKQREAPCLHTVAYFSVGHQISC